jgi:hypothetical protein
MTEEWDDRLRADGLIAVHGDGPPPWRGAMQRARRSPGRRAGKVLIKVLSIIQRQQSKQVIKTANHKLLPFSKLWLLYHVNPIRRTILYFSEPGR